MAIVLPTIIPGPAIIQHNAASFYAKDDIKLSWAPEKFDITTNMHGKIDTRLKKGKWTLGWTPDGQIKDIAKYFPYTAASIGKSIFPAGNAAQVVIWTLNGQKYTFTRGAITKCAQLRLKPTDTWLGDMEITCIGGAATQPTDAAFFNTLATSALADTTFDETLIRTDNYSAAWGADAPYDSMGALDGFEVDCAINVDEIEAADIGIADITLGSIEVTSRFIPSNLTEAQVETLLAYQNAGAILPGQSFSKAGNDLVIASDYLSVTVPKAGPSGYSAMFARGKHRHDAVEFSSRRSWTAGAADPIIDIALV